MGVPQSGKPSVVIPYIESVFGQPPLTLASGSLYNLGIAGTNPGRPHRLNPCNGFDATAIIEKEVDNIDGDGDVHKLPMTGRQYDGEFTFDVDPEAIHIWLMALFGVDTQTTVQAASSNQTPAVYQHVFQPNKKRLYVPSLTVEEDLGNGIYGRLTSGCIVTKIEVTFGPVIRAKVTVMGGHQVPNLYPNNTGSDTQYDFGSANNLLAPIMGGDGTKLIQATTNPTYIDVAEPSTGGNGPLVWGKMAYGSQAAYANNLITVNGVAYAADVVNPLTLTIEHKVSRVQVGGGGYDLAKFISHGWVVTGNIKMLFEDNTIPKNILSNAIFGLNFKVTGPQIGTSGQNYSMEVYIPAFKMEKPGIALTSTEMYCGGDFTARQDYNALVSAMITLINSLSTTSWGGAAIAPTVTAGATITNNTVQNIQVNSSVGWNVGDVLQIYNSSYAPGYTISSIPDGTHLNISPQYVQCGNGPIPAGALVYKLSGNQMVGPGGCGGWNVSP